MGRYIIINTRKTPSVINVPDAPILKTDHAGHAVEMITDICQKDPDAEIHIFGGDGSVFEAVNAIMSSCSSKTAKLVIHPFGTGNDFARNFKEEDWHKTSKIDLIQFNDKYAANEINIGFDCDVVSLTQKVKKLPLIKGAAAYMVSVLLTLFKPMGKVFDISITDETGKSEKIQENLLLCLIGNGGYYGGGFNCAPRASLHDGLLEFIFVKKISRIKFLLFFLGYRKGKHINPDGTIHKKYSSFLYYKRAKAVTLHNIGALCADGEIFNLDTVDITVSQQALRISVEPKAK